MEHCRRATPGDVDALVALAREMRDELEPMRGGALWSVREARPEPLEAAYAALVERDDAWVMIGTIDEVVVGFGVVEIEALRDGTTLGVVTELFVEPEARSVGVGDAIAEMLVEACTRRGCIGVDAWALPGHRATKNFFEAHGFTARSLVMHRSLGESG